MAMAKQLQSVLKSKRFICFFLCVSLVAVGLGLFVLLRGTGAPLEAKPPNAALLEAAQGLDDIQIRARFDSGMHKIYVTQEFSLVNRGTEPRSELVLRAYPNAFRSEETSPIATEEFYDACYPQGFSFGGLADTEFLLSLADEASASASFGYLDDQKTVISIPLPSRWLSGETLQVKASYTLYLPNAASRFGVNNGFIAVGNAFLIPAPFEDGAYRTDPYYPIGDPFVSDCANYTVEVTVPYGYACAGSAWPQVATTADHGLHYLFSAYAVRDFALCVSDRYQTLQAMEGDTLVTVYARDKNQAAQALKYARQALRCFSERFGPYPYPSFTLAEVDFPFGGMEYPGLVMISSGQLSLGGEDLEFLVAHEAAHQWWYAVVGNDQINQAWQDEALCEYSLLDYVETYYGKQRRQDLEFSRIETAMRVTVPRGVTPGSPIDYFGDMSEYSLVVYRRGAAMLLALDHALEGKLDDFLKAYYDEYRFCRATRADFESLLNAFSGEDWTPLMIDYLDTYLMN